MLNRKSRVQVPLSLIQFLYILGLYIYSISLNCTTLKKILRNFLGEFLGLQSFLLDHPLHPCHMFFLVVAAFVGRFLHVVTSLSSCLFSMALLSLLFFCALCCLGPCSFVCWFVWVFLLFQACEKWHFNCLSVLRLTCNFAMPAHLSSAGML